jgi:hypothetical protein
VSVTVTLCPVSIAAGEMALVTVPAEAKAEKSTKTAKISSIFLPRINTF